MQRENNKKQDFIALRRKMYCVKAFEENKPEKQAKGVPKNIVKKDLDVNDVNDHTDALHKRNPTP